MTSAVTVRRCGSRSSGGAPPAPSSAKEASIGAKPPALGIPASGGYSPLYKEPFLRRALDSRGFRAIYPSALLADYESRIDCPGNDRLCREAVWLSQTMLLGPRDDMDQIAEAIRKIRTHAGAIAAG